MQRNIKWLFNPPSGSHFGGVWEQCIRTVRKILVALMKEQPLDDEGLTTLMCEVESVVNGRPITKSSDNASDSETLTPNHLLLLRPKTSSRCVEERGWLLLKKMAPGSIFSRRILVEMD